MNLLYFLLWLLYPIGCNNIKSFDTVSVTYVLFQCITDLRIHFLQSLFIEFNHCLTLYTVYKLISKLDRKKHTLSYQVFTLRKE